MGSGAVSRQGVSIIIINLTKGVTMRITYLFLFIILPVITLAQNEYLSPHPVDFQIVYNVYAPEGAEVRCGEVDMRKETGNFNIPMDGEFHIQGSYDPKNMFVTEVTLMIVPNVSTDYYWLLIEMGYAIGTIIDMVSPFDMTEQDKGAIIDELGIIDGRMYDGKTGEVQAGNRKYWYYISSVTGIWFGVEAVFP